MKQILECVPNFSEGRDMSIIKQITDQIESVEGVKLLDVDPGKATNRIVVTFVGNPDAVIQAAFLSIKKASEIIDMRKHKGAHPRMGATDVCPLVPISEITMEETIVYARKLAKKVGEELKIPVYCYENAAFTEQRKNLANNRAGEYEGLEKKLADPHWKPDFGPTEFNARAGATNIGARDFLIAYNFNLNTTSIRRANAVAFDVREKGRIKRENNSLTGKIIKDKNGRSVYTQGTLKSTKAIGWYIKEYGIAQISMNLTNINITPLHIAFDEVCKKANERGLRVTGSELVGLVPLKVMTDAGKYFLKKQKRSFGISEQEIIKIAVKSLGLDDLKPFNPKEKIIEYLIEQDNIDKLADMNLKEFAEETASESPAPGGGSISAYVGSLGISLATMVANLSANKKAWDNRWEEFSIWAEKGQEIKTQLINLVDQDTNAFNKIMNAFSLPKNTDKEKETRDNAIQQATKDAIRIPFKVMELSLSSMTIIRAMAETGNPNSASDAGVGALCARSAVMGAFLNVKINASSVKDKKFVDDILTKGTEIENKAISMEKEILNIVNEKI